MKKGRAGKRKQGNPPAGKARLTAAKSRIKKVLAKAQKVSLPKVLKKKSLLLKKKITSSVEVPLKRPAESRAAVSPQVDFLSFSDLPFSYNQTKLELLVRDPEWVYSYWDFSGETWRWVMKLLEEDPVSRAKLRIHNLSHQSFYDLDVYLEAKNWYVNLGFPDASFEAELGLLDSKGRFYSIVKSNRIRTPRNGPSAVIDPNWDPSEFGGITTRLSQNSVTQISSSFSSSPRVRKPSAQ